MKNNSLKSLLYLCKIDKSIAFLSVLQALLSALFPYAELFFIAKIIDTVLLGETTNILLFVAALIGANLVMGILIDVLQSVTGYKAAKIERKMVGMIQEKVMEVDYELMEDPAFLKKISDAEYAMEHLGGYVSFVAYYIRLIESWIRVFSSVSVIIALGLLSGTSEIAFISVMASPPVSLALLIGFAAANALFSSFIAKKMKIRDSGIFKKKAEVERKLNYFTDEVFLNYSTGKDIRIFGMSELLLSHHERNMKDARDFFFLNYFKKEQNHATADRIASAVLSFVSYIVVIFKKLVGSITIGEVSGFIGAISIFNASISEIVSIRQRIKLQNEFTGAYYELLNLKPRSSGLPQKTVRKDNEKKDSYAFEFHNVSFKYHGNEEYALKNVSCTLASKMKTAIVGRNGAGKTTLIKLLCRLYEPTEGYITLNGVNITEYDYKEYVALLSVVFQDYKLFALPIRENIAASDKVSDEKVLETLEVLGFAEKINSIPNGTEANLFHYDDDGIEVSGGEAQMIAISRALYKDSPVIILDEPTAALDPVSEHEIYKNFSQLTKDKTSVYISHRMSSCIFCDNIIVIDKGEKVEEGTHDDLIAKKDGVYALLFNTQAKYYAK